MSRSRYAVILAGGYGERFWPLSTRRRPKQLLSLIGGQPLLVAAVERLTGLIPPDRIFVLTSHDLVRACRRLLPSVPADHVVGEPFRRDTAAAVALGAGLVAARDPTAAFCVLPADHIIREDDRFRACLAQAFTLAESSENWLVTLGIRPTWPCTGYGYIKVGDALPGLGVSRAFRVRRFVEKPDAATAHRYLQSGGFYWNGGMFLWRADVLRAAFDRHVPALRDLLDRVAACPRISALRRRLAAWYEPLPRISIDYALMEKADRIAMVEAAFSWDDVGDWPALARHFPADSRGNVVIGEGIAVEADGTIVVSSAGHLTALLGVRDLVVVQAPGVTLVCTRERAQEVKKVVQKLESEGRYRRLL